MNSYSVIQAMAHKLFELPKKGIVGNTVDKRRKEAGRSHSHQHI